MSAILDALKRLETDSHSGSDLPPARETAAGFSRAARHLQARPVFLIASGIVLFCVFGAAIWHTAVLVTTGQKQPAAAVTAKSQVLQTERWAVDKVDKPNDFSSTYPQSFEAEKKGRLRAKTPEQKESTDEVSASPKPMNLARSKYDADLRTGFEPDPEPAPKPKPQAETGPEIMTDGLLTLQAVSWSRSPEKRFAVINGKICREGERIETYEIRRITVKDVWVATGSKTRRLVFKKH